jgi:hypothetical protein
VIEALAVAVACGRVVSRVPFRPPAPIVARTGCGTFLIGTDGSVRRRRASSAPPWAPGAVANGLMTHRGDEIRVRSRSGRLVRVVARGRSPVYDVANAAVLLVSHAGDLIRTDGRHVWRLARGFRPDSWVQLLEHGVIDVTTGRRAVFLRGRVLYIDDEGPLAILDPSGTTSPVDATRALRVLQPQNAALAQLTADWLSRWR